MRLPIIIFLFLASCIQKGQVTNKTNGLTKLDFYTSYRQFYICDKNSTMLTDGEFWTDEALKNRLAKDIGVLGIGTECYGPVKGEIEFLKEAPTNDDLSKFDHVVEGDLNIVSGIIQIQDCPNGAIEFEKEIKSGNYRVRVYSSNLASVEGDEGNDYYRIEVWGDNPQDSKLLKEYKN